MHPHTHVRNNAINWKEVTWSQRELKIAAWRIGQDKTKVGSVHDYQ